MRRSNGCVAAAFAGGLAVASCGGSSEGEGDGTSGAAGSGGSSGAAVGGSSGAGGKGGAGGSSAGGTGGKGGTSGASCKANSECVVVAASCCGTCGAATRDDILAIRADDIASHSAKACAGVAGCDDCYMVQDPNLVATCSGGACHVVDLLLKDETACTTDDECMLRTNDCCACGGDSTETGLVAVSGDITPFVCDPSQPCALCEPLPPENATAECSGGRCRVVWQ